MAPYRQARVAGAWLLFMDPQKMRIVDLFKRQGRLETVGEAEAPNEGSKIAFWCPPQESEGPRSWAGATGCKEEPADLGVL